MISARPVSTMWAALAAVALVQTVALGKIVVDRQALLAAGRELVMKVQPVDPRDIFRGDYVVLGFGLSPVDTALLREAPAGDLVHDGSAVYVTIAEDATHTWKPVVVSTTYPAAISPAEAVLKGLVRNRWTDPATGKSTLDIKYGIESYFVPEGTGAALQANVRNQTVEALIAVGGDGTAAMKGLIIGGERHVDPPLY